MREALLEHGGLVSVRMIHKDLEEHSAKEDPHRDGVAFQMGTDVPQVRLTGRNTSVIIILGRFC